MNRKHVIILAAAVVADLAFILWYFAPHAASKPALSHGNPTPVFRASSLPGVSGSSGPVVDALDPGATGSPLAAELNAPGGDAERDVRALHGLLRQYLRILHHRQGPPIGDDIDLAHVLTGHNPMKMVFIPPGHPALSADGHLHDRWGTPYFIHAIGYGAFEVRSAGPDRKLFTGDDLVDGPAPPAAHTDIPDLDLRQ